jgi:hypothetical protein
VVLESKIGNRQLKIQIMRSVFSPRAVRCFLW